MGREVMGAYGLEPQVALTVEYLDSWDGNGMSASRGNYIGLREAPEEQFGKAMRIPDSLLPQWYRLVKESEPPNRDPLEAKLELARFIVERAHGAEGAKRGEEYFTRVVREGGTPDEAEIPVASVDDGEVYLPQLLSEQFGQSNSHWRRVIEQGGVKIDGEPVREIELPAERLQGNLIQAGKRQFVRVSGA
jgi:tyrosyl-tRNA synthetase